MSLFIKRSSFVGLIGVPVFLALCVTYYFYFSEGLQDYVPDASVLIFSILSTYTK